MKVMGSNPGYLLKSFLLYLYLVQIFDSSARSQSAFGGQVQYFVCFSHCESMNRIIMPWLPKHPKIVNSCKVENILKGSLDSIPSPSSSGKIQIVGGKVCLRCKGKTLLGIFKNFWKQKVCWHHPAMFCLITSSKLSRQLFEFSLKMKVMGLNPGCLLKSTLWIWCTPISISSIMGKSLSYKWLYLLANDDKFQLKHKTCQYHQTLYHLSLIFVAHL